MVPSAVSFAMLMKALSEVRVKVEVKPGVDNLVFRLHYRYSYIVFLAAALLATLYDAIGKDDETGLCSCV